MASRRSLSSPDPMASPLTRRANFPAVTSGGVSLLNPVHGGYSGVQTFDRTITAPLSPVTSFGSAMDFSFTWD